MDYAPFFAGKKITLMGLGLLGRGMGDARFLASLGADLIVTDLKSEEALEESVASLREYPNITFHLGGHRMEDFEDRDLIIKAAGVPQDSPYIAHAVEHNVPVAMSTALFAQFAREAGATLVGVTGTRGKSTVTQMIYFALCRTSDPKTIHVGGNVLGRSTLEMLPDIKPKDIVVLELDSWQLQGFGDLRLSPDIAVFTNFMPDHLNYYHGDMDAYFADKANIFMHQKPGDTLVVGSSVIERIKAMQPPVEPVVPESIPQKWELMVPGQHNRDNAALAAEALRVFLEEEEIWESLTSFRGVPGRLELVRELGGVKIYNDTNSTTPDAAIVGLRALDPGAKKNIVLITGGTDKQLDMSAYLAEVRAHAKSVCLLAGSGTQRIKHELPDAAVYDSLPKALAEAWSKAAPGDIILFSPAFTSFEMFKNEYDRGEQFNTAVELLS